MNIKVLDPHIINQISAGEVIERPSSVIKELVENSIDAGAEKIAVHFREGGKSFIQVKDDGHGMCKDDLELCIKPHTTSKLLDNDLFNIKTFGFRGEALASISSVSRTTIVSKEKSQDLAWKLCFDRNKVHEISPLSLAKQGTTVTIQDLFYITPARLKFLKTNRTERARCLEVLNNFAISYPHIEFKVYDCDKLVYDFEKTYSIKDRIFSIFGSDLIDNISFFDEEIEGIKIHGTISVPTYHFNRSSKQFFFVNNRPVKDKLLNIAVRIAYQDLIPHGCYPFVVLFVDIPFEDIDVNVHPTKAEIRFKDEACVRSAVIQSLQKALTEISKRTSTLLSKKTVTFFKKPIFTSHYSKETFKPLVQEKSHLLENDTCQEMQPVFQKDIELYKEENDPPLGFAKVQLFDTYILSQTKVGIVLVDQHAAHERILYEALKQEIKDQNVSVQHLLMPEMCKITKSDCDILKEYENELLRLGVGLEFFDDAVSIKYLPALFKLKETSVQLIVNIIEGVKKSDININERILYILANFACKQSIKAGDKISIEEMDALLRQMEKTEHSAQCNHGRPVYVKLNKEDLDKVFDRR
ncbi:MAG: DNA mismatch repair endonuclease MutL [Alphaproteobacteria bacterium]